MKALTLSLLGCIFSLVVQLDYISPRGGSTSKTRFWRGIPFAQPPIRELRFKPPRKPHDALYRTIVSAVDPAPFCMQESQKFISEDCLTLDVVIPLDSYPHSNLPVIVYLNHDPSPLSSSDHKLANDVALVTSGLDAVVVTINYRVGVFARLNGINLGLLDQQMALEWVQRYIMLFNGHPSRVTIVAFSVATHYIRLQMLAKPQKALFNSVILLEPSLFGEFTLEQPQPPVSGVSLLQNVISRLECPIKRPLTCLMKADSDDLLQASIGIDFTSDLKHSYPYPESYFVGEYRKVRILELSTYSRHCGLLNGVSDMAFKKYGIDVVRLSFGTESQLLDTFWQNYERIEDSVGKVFVDVLTRFLNDRNMMIDREVFSLVTDSFTISTEYRTNHCPYQVSSNDKNKMNK